MELRQNLLNPGSDYLNFLEVGNCIIHSENGIIFVFVVFVISE